MFVYSWNDLIIISIVLVIQGNFWFSSKDLWGDFLFLRDKGENSNLALEIFPTICYLETWTTTPMTN